MKVTVRPPDTVNLAGSPTDVARAFIINRDGTVADMGNVASGWSGTPLGYRQLTNMQLVAVRTLAEGVDPANGATGIPDGAARAMIQNNGAQPIRWCDDGAAPSGSAGQRIYGGATLDYRGDLSKFRTIREDDGATLDILFYS